MVPHRGGKASAAGTVWVLERASDGVRISLKVAGRAAHASAHAIGGAVVVTALSTGQAAAAGPQVIAFVPNLRLARPCCITRMILRP